MPFLWLSCLPGSWSVSSGLWLALVEKAKDYARQQEWGGGVRSALLDLQVSVKNNNKKTPKTKQQTICHQKPVLCCPRCLGWTWARETGAEAPWWPQRPTKVVWSIKDENGLRAKWTVRSWSGWDVYIGRDRWGWRRWKPERGEEGNIGWV